MLLISKDQIRFKVIALCRVVKSTMKDVRANPLCASLLQTQFMPQRHATVMRERALKGRNLFIWGNSSRCVNFA